MDNMTAGQELLRQKEDRLKVMENALLGGGLVSNFSLFVIISFIRSNFNSRAIAYMPTLRDTALISRSPVRVTKFPG